MRIQSRRLFKLKVIFSALVVPLLLSACGSSDSSVVNADEVSDLQLSRNTRSQQCSVVADSLTGARAGFGQQCGGAPRDCDPVDAGWMCSSSVIGLAAPSFSLGDVAGDVCSVTAGSLDAARQSYANACSMPVRDCDPVDGQWICSSIQIGAAAPAFTAPQLPTTPEPETAPKPEPTTPDPAEPSPIVSGLSLAAQWNELGLAAVRSGSARPTATTWQMFVLSASIYDAVSAYSPNSTPYALSPELRRPAREHTESNRREAASQAAFQALSFLFPSFENQNGFFKSYLNSLGYSESTSSDNSPSSIGYQAAMAVIKDRSNDGSNSKNDFEPITSLIFPELYTPVNSPDPVSSNGTQGPDFNPNAWQPLRVPNGTVLNDDELAVVDNLNLNSFGDQEFLSSHWGAVTPFALTFGSEFRPSPPPMVFSDEIYTDAVGFVSTNDEAYRKQIEEVLSYSANLNDRLKVIAEFWADGPRTESPPGHWNQLAHGIIERDDQSLTEASQMLFALNGALLDAGIATWEAKRHYNYIRPASAIRWLYNDVQIEAWGGPNMDTQLILGQDWSPYQTITFVTPPFPEYVSGHSTFSRAAAEVLTRFTGSGSFYDGVTVTMQDVNNDGELDVFGEHIAKAGSFFIEEGPASDVVLQWPTFQDAADEAGKSRLFGGIHIQDGDLRGRELGRKVGERAFNRAMSYIKGEL